MEISEKIKRIREYFSFNQKEFAEKIGITQAAVSRYEKKERMPDTVFLEKLIDVFQINPSWLLGNLSSNMLIEDDLCLKAKELAIANKREKELSEILINFLGKQNTICVLGGKLEKLKAQNGLEGISEQLSGKGERMLRVLHDFLIYLQKQNIRFSPEFIKKDFINSLDNYSFSPEFKVRYLGTTGKKDKANLLKWAEEELDDASIFEIMSTLQELIIDVENRMNSFDRFLIKVIKPA
ncbi:helix-turn-helix domain-containing protein [Aliarcobacter butzleri]|uniref:helix-turn-helix domain-containing protein n=1 Tax=Aliarcobacter butzleri TaxID=28197 RepID=UPI001C0A6A10|nr:helix-turn-helix transcriptional regulator [Aliarcobacter butzleri]